MLTKIKSLLLLKLPDFYYPINNQNLYCFQSQAI